MSQVAPPDAVVALAETLNRRLAEMQDPNSRSKRSWFQLFNHMDGDGTGRITYSEFEGVVRKELQFSPKELPSGALATVWAALDTDSTGFVGAGEFGAFMRRGEHAISRINPKDARLAIALQLRATLEAEGTQRMREVTLTLTLALTLALAQPQPGSREAALRSRGRRRPPNPNPNPIPNN